ncbi:MAG: hypothetical protein ACERKD_07500 [Prolixibacteraceae bacterium]
MVNTGGGLSEKWVLTGLDKHISVLYKNGNLRGEEENYFQIDTKGLKSGEEYTKSLIIKGESGSEASVIIKYQIEEL